MLSSDTVTSIEEPPQASSLGASTRSSVNNADSCAAHSEDGAAFGDDDGLVQHRADDGSMRSFDEVFSRGSTARSRAKGRGRGARTRPKALRADAGRKVRRGADVCRLRRAQHTSEGVSFRPEQKNAFHKTRFSDPNR